MVAVAPMTTDGASGTDEAPDTAAFFAAIDVLAAFTSAVEPGRYSGEDVGRILRAYTRVERLGVAGKALYAARVAESNAHLRTGHRSPAEALSAQTGDPLGDSIGLLRLGQTLERQPGLEEALREGDLSRARAALVSDAIASAPDKEAELVDGARHDTFTQLKQRCLRAKVEARSAEEQARHHQALHRMRRCNTSTDRDGAFRLEAVLAPAAGASLLAALQVQADRRFERARAAGQHEDPQAYRADALLALVTGTDIVPPRRRGVRAEDGRPGAGLDATSSSDSDSGSFSDSDPDAHAHAATGADDRSPDPKVSMAIRVDLDALRRGSVSDGELCEIPGVGPVPVEWARRQLGSALLELVIANATDVTTIYRMGRHVPPVILSALLERDPTCVVPGCDKRLGLENDHWATEFAKGGLISMENLARVCRDHHRLRTHRGFQLLRGPDGWEWRAPDAPVRPRRPRSKGRNKGSKSPPDGSAEPPLFRPDP